MRLQVRPCRRTGEPVVHQQRLRGRFQNGIETRIQRPRSRLDPRRSPRLLHRETIERRASTARHVLRQMSEHLVPRMNIHPGSYFSASCFDELPHRLRAFRHPVGRCVIDVFGMLQIRILEDVLQHVVHRGREPGVHRRSLPARQEQRIFSGKRTRVHRRDRSGCDRCRSHERRLAGTRSRPRRCAEIACCRRAGTDRRNALHLLLDRSVGLVVHPTRKSLERLGAAVFRRIEQCVDRKLADVVGQAHIGAHVDQAAGHVVECRIARLAGKGGQMAGPACQRLSLHLRLRWAALRRHGLRRSGGRLEKCVGLQTCVRSKSGRFVPDPDDEILEDGHVPLVDQGREFGGRSVMELRREIGVVGHPLQRRPHFCERRLVPLRIQTGQLCGPKHRRQGCAVRGDVGRRGLGGKGLGDTFARKVAGVDPAGVATLRRGYECRRERRCGGRRAFH